MERKSKKITMKMVQARGRHRKHPNRKPPQAKVSPTGLTKVNVQGTEDLNGIAREATLDVATYNVALGYDEESGYIGIYPVPGGTPGSVRIRRNKDRTCHLYLYDIFDEEPSLRPLVERNCELVIGTDEHGVKCLLLGISSSLLVGSRSTQEQGEGQKKGKKSAKKAEGKPKNDVAAGSQTSTPHHSEPQADAAGDQ